MKLKKDIDIFRDKVNSKTCEWSISITTDDIGDDPRVLKTLTIDICESMNEELNYVDSKTVLDVLTYTSEACKGRTKKGKSIEKDSDDIQEFLKEDCYFTIHNVYEIDTFEGKEMDRMTILISKYHTLLDVPDFNIAPKKIHKLLTTIKKMKL